jgi:AcrR family transcriptional regulator
MTMGQQESSPDAPRRRRARSSAAKLARRNRVIDAAIGFLTSADLEAVSIARVAAEAGIAKGTVYLYFRTKEELFLAALERELEGWFDELDAALGTGQGWMPAAGLADLVTGAFERRRLLRRLQALAGPVLERNLDADRGLRFKWRVAGRLSTTGSLLERRTVFLRPGDGARLLLHLQALAAGIQGISEPAPPMRGVLDAPGLELFRLEFAREFRAAALALLTGLERTN